MAGVTKHRVIPGQSFGLLTVLCETRLTVKSGSKRAALCECECGETAVVRVPKLYDGTARSCGCLRRRVNKDRCTTHGLTGHPLLKTWYNMVARCEDPRSASFKWYGAVGVRVSKEWRSGPLAFVAYVTQNLGPRPEGHSLDRIDPYGDYAPGNVRWASAETQRANQRSADAPR